MDEEFNQRLLNLEAKVEKIWHSVEQTRKIIFWTMIVSVALFVLPLIGLAIAIPQYLKSVDINSLLQ